MNKVKINIPDYQLNLYLTNSCPFFEGAKSWQRIDVGDQETYVGDGAFVITLIKHQPASIEEMQENCKKVQPVVIRYLLGEGFITDAYLYIALQELDLKRPIEGMDIE